MTPLPSNTLSLTHDTISQTCVGQGQLLVSSLQALAKCLKHKNKCFRKMPYSLLSYAWLKAVSRKYS